MSSLTGYDSSSSIKANHLISSNIRTPNTWASEAQCLFTPVRQNLGLSFLSLSPSLSLLFGSWSMSWDFSQQSWCDSVSPLNHSDLQQILRKTYDSAVLINVTLIITLLLFLSNICLCLIQYTEAFSLKAGCFCSVYPKYRGQDIYLCLGLTETREGNTAARAAGPSVQGSLSNCYCLC